jgi:signal transduction histidine kinase
MDDVIRILLLEDVAADAEMLERLLVRAGLSVAVKRVATEQAFRREILIAPYDVIVADYHLPGFDGMSALQIARETAPHIPFVFVSGSIGEERAVRALQQGAIDYIMKDRPSRLPSAILRAIEVQREAESRRRIQDALIRSEQRFYFAAQATRDVIRDWNVESGSIWASDSLLSDWGHDIDEAELGVAWWEAHIHPEDVAKVRASLEDAFRSDGERWSEEYRFRRGDQSYGHVLERGLIIRRPDGTVTRMITAVQDISLRIDAEQGKRLSTLGRIAATMAHEFNNVLMGIQPFAELVRKKATEPRLTQAANQILKSVARGRRVTLDILRTTQMAAPALQEVDLGAWLRQAEEEIKALMTERTKVTVITPEAPLYASCDPSQLQQVIANLAVNAHDAMREGGLLTISLNVAPRDDQSIEMTVRDTGAGIPPDVLPRIFEPLYTTKTSGTGLGLAVVQQIVTRHDGTLSVESTQGAGTTFRIRLPRVTPAVPAEEAPEDSSLERVLLVEDDEIVAEGLVQLLGLEGLHVDVVSHGAMVVEAVDRLRPHVVVLDIALPDMNGMDVYDRLTERWPDLAVIFSSGNADTQPMSRYLDHPRVRFLHKPYEFDSLLKVLREIA